jgi:hypothetical protein
MCILSVVSKPFKNEEYSIPLIIESIAYHEQSATITVDALLRNDS